MNYQGKWTELFFLSYLMLFVFISFVILVIFFFFQAEDGIRDRTVTGVQTCALPILLQAGRGVDAGRIELVREADRRRRALILGPVVAQISRRLHVVDDHVGRVGPVAAVLVDDPHRQRVVDVVGEAALVRRVGARRVVVERPEDAAAAVVLVMEAGRGVDA